MSTSRRALYSTWNGDRVDDGRGTKQGGGGIRVNYRHVAGITVGTGDDDENFRYARPKFHVGGEGDCFENVLVSFSDGKTLEVLGRKAVTENVLIHHQRSRLVIHPAASEHDRGKPAEKIRVTWDGMPNGSNGFVHGERKKVNVVYVSIVFKSLAGATHKFDAIGNI